MRFLGNALSGWWEQQSEGSLKSLVTGPLKQEEEQVRVGEVIKEGNGIYTAASLTFHRTCNKELEQPLFHMLNTSSIL